MKSATLTKTYKRAKQSDCSGLPNSIRYYRLKAGMNMQQLADILSTSIQTVWQMETKTRFVHRKHAYRMSEIFHVDPREIDRSRENFT